MDPPRGSTTSGRPFGRRSLGTALRRSWARSQLRLHRLVRNAGLVKRLADWREAVASVERHRVRLRVQHHFRIAALAREAMSCSSSAAPTPLPRHPARTATRPMYPSGSSRPQPIARSASSSASDVTALSVDTVPLERLGNRLLDAENVVANRLELRLVGLPVGQRARGTSRRVPHHELCRPSPVPSASRVHRPAASACRARGRTAGRYRRERRRDHADARRRCRARTRCRADRACSR